MTENQRPEDSAYPAPQATPGTTGERAPSTFPAAAPQTRDTVGTSRKDAVKEEAGDVARTAADSAQSVAETAKTEAGNVASEAKANAKDLLHQARSDLTEQAGAQQQKVANGLRSVSDELHAMARASDQPGVATDLVRQAAERSSSVASWLDGRDPGSLLDEVKSFARQRPGTFLLLAAGAGVLAGRLSRSLSAGAPESATHYAGARGQYGGGQYGAGGQYDSGYTPSAGGTVPPPPVQLPGPATTTAGYDGGTPGSSYGDPSRPASPLDSPQLAAQPFSTNRIADDPLADRELADDPMANDPLTRDRSADGQAGRL
ncbi:hypothetical protein [Pseudarthrobacter raffinosi]|uniref:hypothetical protein n=1 Tax=Pseudarthrobacter raffinosi TaxID=2953651 RepID=UPI00208EE865|nr:MULTISPECIES: hypothetical protein [unclassified Pseudarthrobacter]MCO4238252.1 hypothetical protein [Pseudarthrobacter sp. MDT3-28]MCO4264148.1 hypothetical protein [Pseudarthrobacter sp. MDT3-26]